MTSTDLSSKNISQPSSHHKTNCNYQLARSSEEFSELALNCRDTIFAEEQIIDLLATSNRLCMKTINLCGFCLRNPFKPGPFSQITTKGVHQSFGSNYDLLKKLFVKFGYQYFIDEFESGFSYVLAYQGDFFNALGRLIKCHMSVWPTALVCFLLFLSRHFKKGLVIFALEFLLLLNFALNRLFIFHKDKQHFILEALCRPKECSIVTDIEHWYRLILCHEGALAVEPALLTSAFVLYLKGNQQLFS